MKIVILLLISFFAYQGSSRVQEYYTIFSLTWLQGFCGDGSKCKRDVVDTWDHQSFSIHGLWTDDYRNHRNYQGTIWFKKYLYKGQLLKQMKSYMPPSSVRGKSSHFLWEHECQVHSDEYALVQKLLGSKKSENELQVQYFQDMIKQYLKLNVRKMPYEYWTKKQLAAHLKLKEDQFSVICRSSKEKDVEQIRICLQIDKNGMKPIKCKRDQSKNCKSPRDRLWLKGWQQRGSKNVFDYEQNNDL